MAFDGSKAEGEWPVELRASGDRCTHGRVLRSRDDMLIVAIGVGQSRIWRTGDAVHVLHSSASAPGVSRKGRVYSTYKTLAADHVVVDVAEVGGARAPAGTTTPGDLRIARRVRPESGRPVLAVLTVGHAAVEGRARSLSAEGMGLYVPEHDARPFAVGTAGSLAFTLPGAARTCRFETTVVRQRALTHGVLYGLTLHTVTSRFLEQQQDLLRYIRGRQDEARFLGND